jgi:hypothetical protein
LVGKGSPHLLHQVTSADDLLSPHWVLVLCRQFFSAGSCKLAILAM